MVYVLNSDNCCYLLSSFVLLDDVDVIRICLFQFVNNVVINTPRTNVSLLTRITCYAHFATEISCSISRNATDATVTV